jgi:CRP-like cAMP-binding protein
MTYYGDKAFPAPSDEQWARLQSYGSAQEVESGALPWGAGEATYDLILVDSGEAKVVRAATARAAEAVVARFGTGRFAGELSLLARQAAYLSSPISKPGCTAAAILRPSPCTPQRRATTARLRPGSAWSARSAQREDERR